MATSTNHNIDEMKLKNGARDGIRARLESSVRRVHTKVDPPIGDEPESGDCRSLKIWLRPSSDHSEQDRDNAGPINARQARASPKNDPKAYVLVENSKVGTKDTSLELHVRRGVTFRCFCSS